MTHKLSYAGTDVRTIDVYKTTLDLLDAADPGKLHPLIRDMLADDECRSVLQGADDYETFGYLLINDEVVIQYDTINGEVYNQEDLHSFGIYASKYILDQLGWPEAKAGDTDPVIF